MRKGPRQLLAQSGDGGDCTDTRASRGEDCREGGGVAAAHQPHQPRTSRTPAGVGVRLCSSWRGGMTAGKRRRRRGNGGDEM